MPETMKIPLFPLGLVLLPGMRLPLHIFEDRYRQMISECIRDMTPFGVVLFDGQTIHAVGCLARITELVERYDDGRMDILTRGGDRFVIREIIEEKAYMEAKIIIFDDEVDNRDRDMVTLVRTALRLIGQAVDGDPGLTALTPDGSIDPRQLSFDIAALEGFSPADRQDVLEMVSPSERLEKCVQALSRIIERNTLTREIHKTIRGNGTPPKRILK